MYQHVIVESIEQWRKCLRYPIVLCLSSAVSTYLHMTILQDLNKGDNLNQYPPVMVSTNDGLNKNRKVCLWWEHWLR